MCVMLIFWLMHYVNTTVTASSLCVHIKHLAQLSVTKAYLSMLRFFLLS